MSDRREQPSASAAFSDAPSAVDYGMAGHRLFLIAPALFLSTFLGCGDDNAVGIDAGTVPDGSQGLPVAAAERIFTTAPLDRNCLYASPIAVTSQGEELLFLVGVEGAMRLVDPDSGSVVWEAEVPREGTEYPYILATPTKVGDRYLLLAWQDLETVPVIFRARHRARMFDLETRDWASEFPPLDFAASVPAQDGTGSVVFDSRYQLLRSELEHIAVQDRELGLAYVSFGNGPSQQPFHGWVFELDLDGWRSGGPSSAVANVLVTTAENGCGTPGNQDAMLCGGGVWNAAGLVPYEDATGHHLLVPTGNGNVDYEIGAYAHSVLRVEPGLQFAPNCDASLCANFDDQDPDPACLASCENVFTARLAPGDTGIFPEDGTCDGLTFQQCYAALDADLGASSPAIVDVPGGPRVIVQPGKDGALYLADLENLGTMYQRLQVMDFCGTPSDPCDAFWVGMFVTEPAATVIDGTPVVIVASVMADRTHPSGITALDVGMTPEGPRMTIRWQVPGFDTMESKQMFRHHPGRPVIVTVDNEAYVFVVETRRGTGPGSAPPPGILWGVRVRDGFPAVQQPLTDAGQRFIRPLVRDDMLYVNSCDVRAETNGVLEAFRIGTLAP